MFENEKSTAKRIVIACLLVLSVGLLAFYGYERYFKTVPDKEPDLAPHTEVGDGVNVDSPDGFVDPESAPQPFLPKPQPDPKMSEPELALETTPKPTKPMPTPKREDHVDENPMSYAPDVNPREDPESAPQPEPETPEPELTHEPKAMESEPTFELTHEPKMSEPESSFDTTPKPTRPPVPEGPVTESSLLEELRIGTTSDFAPV